MFKAIIIFSAITCSLNAQVITETFGSGANQFSMDFVGIGNTNNTADTTGPQGGMVPYGRVNYLYNMGIYEVSRSMVDKANTAAGLGITLQDMSSAGGNGADRPATGISWFEAAKFVNYLNTSKGYQAAYNFDTSGNFQLWGAGQYSGTNQYRHKDAYFFLPTRDEWHKSAFGSPTGTWYNYSTGSDTVPTSVTGGTASGTSVYGLTLPGTYSPADIQNAGGFSAYGTMAQSGNAWEWIETANDGTNDNTSENREFRGGIFASVESQLRASFRLSITPTDEGNTNGFRVASVPEPSALSLLAVGLGVVLRRRRRTV